MNSNDERLRLAYGTVLEGRVNGPRHSHPEPEALVALAERSGSEAVRLEVLDHVSRSLPESLWLTTMSQDGDTLMLEGRSTTLIALSDFVGNLGGSALLRKPIEIITSQVEAPNGRNQSDTDVIRFAVRAQVTPPPDRSEPAAKDAGKKKKSGGRAKAARS